MKYLQCKKDFESERLLFVAGRPKPTTEAADQQAEGKKAPAEMLSPEAARKVAARYSQMVDEQFKMVEEAFGEQKIDSRTKKTTTVPYKLDRTFLATKAPKEITAKYSKKIPSRVLMALAEMAQIQAGLKKAGWRVKGETVAEAGQRLDELNTQLYRGSERLVKDPSTTVDEPALGFSVQRATGTRSEKTAYRVEGEMVAAEVESKRAGETVETPKGIANRAADLNKARKDYEALTRYNMSQLVEKGIIILPEGVDPKSAQARELVAERKAELRTEIVDNENALKRLAHNIDEGKYGLEGNVAIQRSRDGQKYMVLIMEGGQYGRREFTYIGTNPQASDFNLNQYELYNRAHAWYQKKQRDKKS